MPENGNVDAPVEPTPPPEVVEGQDVNALPAWARTALTKANTEAAKHRVRVRELEPIAKAQQEAEDAKKSETERLTGELTNTRTRAESAELNLLRLQVGLDKGLTPAQARRLSGKTKEELEADADDLLEAFGAGKPATDTGRTGSGRPRERLRGGSEPDNEPDELDPAKLAAKVPRKY